MNTADELRNVVAFTSAVGHVDNPGDFKRLAERIKRNTDLASVKADIRALAIERLRAHGAELPAPGETVVWKEYKVGDKMMRFPVGNCILAPDSPPQAVDAKDLLTRLDALDATMKAGATESAIVQAIHVGIMAANMGFRPLEGFAAVGVPVRAGQDASAQKRSESVGPTAADCQRLVRKAMQKTNDYTKAVQLVVNKTGRKKSTIYKYTRTLNPNRRKK